MVRYNNTRSLVSKSYESIKNSIIYFDIKPGEKIFEVEIAKKLNMSRTPVRESLYILESEGFIERDPKLGFIVKKISMNDVEEYFSIRKVIELYSVPLVIERISLNELEALEENIKKAKAHIEKSSIRDIIRSETEFHEILYNSVKSDIFKKTISNLLSEFHWIRAIALSAPGGPKVSLNDHENMLKAIRQKDKNKFRKLVITHLNHAKKYAFRQGVFF